MILRQLSFLASQQLLVLLHVGLDLSELRQQFVVHENLQVFLMIVSLVSPFELLLGLTGIDALQDAEASKVFKRQLKLANGFRAGKVLGMLSFLPLIDFLAHY